MVDPKLVLDSPQLLDSPPGSGCSPAARRHRVAAAARARSVPARASCRSGRRAHEVRKPRTGPPRASRSEVPRAQLAAAARAMTSSRPSRAVEGNKPAGRSQRRPSRKCCNLHQHLPQARAPAAAETRSVDYGPPSCSWGGDRAPRGSAASPSCSRSPPRPPRSLLRAQGRAAVTRRRSSSTHGHIRRCSASTRSTRSCSHGARDSGRSRRSRRRSSSAAARR